jgi:putative hydrolase of the HAD superfamily
MLDGRKIDAVLLDVGGVFHLPDHHRVGAALATLGITVDPSDLDRAHYEGVAALDQVRAGDESIWHAYNRAYARVCGIPDARLDDATEVLLADFGRGGAWTRVIPGAADALRRLAEQGRRLAVVSNADGTVEQQLRDDGICHVGSGPGVRIDAVLDSSVVGVAKPDPAIFHLALERTGVDAERAVHVGDTPAADVAGARAAGITPVLIDPYGLHPDERCVRVTSLADLAGRLESG